MEYLNINSFTTNLHGDISTFNMDVTIYIYKYVVISLIQIVIKCIKNSKSDMNYKCI